MENTLVSRMPAAASQDIHSLPPEVIAKIFLISLPDPAHPSMSQSPLNVSQTCRLWRDISLSLPILWTQLFFRYDPANGRASMVLAMERWIKVLEAWIQRSGKETLNVEISPCQIHWTSKFSPAAGERFREVVSGLMKVLPRWGDVTIDFRNNNKAFDISCSNMTALRSLRIYGDDDRDYATNLDIDLTLSSHIQRLDLLGVRSIEVGETYFRSLTELQLDLRTYSDSDKCLDMCIHLLQQAPSLVVLNLTLSPDDNHRTQSQTDFIVLNHLKEIRINMISLFYIEILRRLILPSLRRMELVFYPGIPDIERVFYDLLHRSRPPLEYLKYYGQVSMDALKLLPALETLELLGQPSRELLRDLAIDYSGRPCPQLKELTIINRRWPGDCTELVIDILVSRTQQIRGFSARFEGSAETDWLKYLREDLRVQSCMLDGLALIVFPFR